MKALRTSLTLAIAVLLALAYSTYTSAKRQSSQPSKAAFAAAAPLFAVVEHSPFGNYSSQTDYYGPQNVRWTGHSKPLVLEPSEVCRDFFALGQQLGATIFHPTGFAGWSLQRHEGSARMACVNELSASLRSGGPSYYHAFDLAGSYDRKGTAIPFTATIEQVRLKKPCTKCSRVTVSLESTDTEPMPPNSASIYAGLEPGNVAVRLIMDRIGAERRAAATLSPTSTAVLQTALSKVTLPLGLSARLIAETATTPPAVELTIPYPALLCFAGGESQTCEACMSLAAFSPSTYGFADPGREYWPIETEVAAFPSSHPFGAVVGASCAQAFSGRAPQPRSA